MVCTGTSEVSGTGAGRGQVLAPWPNRLADGSYSFGGRELQVPLSEPETRTAIHGLVRFANWVCVRHERDRVELEHVLHPQPGYPFLLRLRVAYRLDDEGLTVETFAENAGTEAAPFGVKTPDLVWGAPRADFALMKKLKGAYDGANVCSPGRFVGGI